MEIHPSARKYGIADEDIEHAMSNAIAIDDQEDDMRLYLGPARNAKLLEVGTVVRQDGTELVIHAMQLRPRYQRLLPVSEMAKKTYGKTKSGIEITDDVVERLAAKAEAGFDVEKILRRRGGRPPLGSAPARVESVRLDPELQQALTDRAAKDHESTSSVIRKALRQYLTLG